MALVMVLRNHKSYDFLSKSYFRFLFIRWKVVTFLIAAFGGIVIAPYTGDYTWDYYDMAMMSALTYLSAPWAVGAMYRFYQRRLSLEQAYVAFCMMFFSASWSYDAYLLFRDGFYPYTWLYNIPPSLVLYLSAGLLWNLDWDKDRGVIFTFVRDGWLKEKVEAAFRKVFWHASAFIALVAIMYGFFVLNCLYLKMF
jgi:hypothetical protein